ncbi:hypothetical protein PsWM33_02020 [Pseudovibrio sp. WM33]|nr:hypothetical protein PsWM33_02020 [Pseudovibrio sp. WM33]
MPAANDRHVGKNISLTAFPAHNREFAFGNLTQDTKRPRITTTVTAKQIRCRCLNLRRYRLAAGINEGSGVTP